VLITSRNPAWRGVAATVGVREFVRAESISLLRRLAPELTAVEADRLADAVGDLPLAIEQAGSLLADTGMTTDKYLRLLCERAQDVLDHDPGGTYPQSLAASWAVAFDRLAADDPTALTLLTVVAWCGPEPVPLIVLTGHPDSLPVSLRLIATDPLVLARCTAILHRRGMATVSPHDLQLHRVPAALLRARSQASQDAPVAGWAASVVRLLDQAAPANVRFDPGGWPLWRRLLPHVLAAVNREAALDTVPADAARLLDRAVTYLFMRGELQAALAPCERAFWRGWVSTSAPARPWASTSRPGVHGGFDQVRVDPGEMPGERVEWLAAPVTVERGVGGGQPVQVGHQRRAQRRCGLAHPLGEALPQQCHLQRHRVHRCGVEHAEVEQHPAGWCAPPAGNGAVRSRRRPGVAGTRLATRRDRPR
jgi:hypothetical protein